MAESDAEFISQKVDSFLEKLFVKHLGEHFLRSSPPSKVRLKKMELMDAADRLLRRHRNTLVPLHRLLPADIIRIIFEVALDYDNIHGFSSGDCPRDWTSHQRYYANLATIRGVCSSWNHTILDTPSLWSLVTLQDNHKAPRRIQQSKASALALFLQNQTTSEEADLQFLRPHLDRIHVIHVEGFNDNAILALERLATTRFSNVRIAEVVRSQAGWREDRFTLDLPSLQALRIERLHVVQPLTMFGGLRHLDVFYPVGAVGLALMPLITQNPLIERLRIYGEMRYIDEQRHWKEMDVPRTLPLPHLRSLHLHHNGGLFLSAFLRSVDSPACTIFDIEALPPKDREEPPWYALRKHIPVGQPSRSTLCFSGDTMSFTSVFGVKRFNLLRPTNQNIETLVEQSLRLFGSKLDELTLHGKFFTTGGPLGKLANALQSVETLELVETPAKTLKEVCQWMQLPEDAEDTSPPRWHLSNLKVLKLERCAVRVDNVYEMVLLRSKSKLANGMEIQPAPLQKIEIHILKSHASTYAVFMAKKDWNVEIKDGRKS